MVIIYGQSAIKSGLKCPSYPINKLPIRKNQPRLSTC